MDRSREIRELLRDITNGGGLPLVIGEVVSVESETCTVKVAGRVTVGDVRLNASADGNEGNILVKPVVGSMVLMSDLSGGDLRELVVTAWSEIDTVTVKFKGDVSFKSKDELELAMKGDKFSVTKKGTALKAELDNLLDALATAVIATPAGTGAFAADTIAKINNVKTKINEILC